MGAQSAEVSLSPSTRGASAVGRKIAGAPEREAGGAVKLSERPNAESTPPPNLSRYESILYHADFSLYRLP